MTQPQTAADKVRDLIARADRERRAADAADMARVKIRVWQRPVQRGGLLGFLRRSETGPGQDVFFDAAETAAIYDALYRVQQDHLQRARDLDAEIGSTR